MNKSKEKFKGFILMLCATLFWGSSFVVSKGATEGFPLAYLVAFRFIIAAVFLSVIYWKKYKLMNKNLIAICALIAALDYYGILLQTAGIKYTSAGRSAFLTSAFCIFTPFVEWIILKRKPNAKILLSSVLCLIGVGFIVLKENFKVDSGDLYTLSASLLFAFMLVLMAKAVSRYDSIAVTIGMQAIGGIIGIVTALIIEPFPKKFTMSTSLAVCYLAVICSALPNLFQLKAQQVLSASAVSVILGFEAVFAAVLSAIVFHETLTAKSFIGCALIFISSFVSISTGKKTTNEEA